MISKILQTGSLDSIPSPSPARKIQIVGGKVCSSSSTNPAMFCLITSSKLSCQNLNFLWRWRWWDKIQAIFLKLFYIEKPPETFWKLLTWRSIVKTERRWFEIMREITVNESGQNKSCVPVWFALAPFGITSISYVFIFNCLFKYCSLMINTPLIQKLSTKLLFIQWLKKAPNFFQA